MMLGALAVVASLGLLAVADNGNDAGSLELDRLQGEWKMLSGRQDGVETSKESATLMNCTVRGARVSFKREGKIVEEVTIKLDASKNPKALDADLGNGRVSLGIYRLEEDFFTLCYVHPGKSRPVDFTAREGSGASLSVWTRVKKLSTPARASAIERVSPDKLHEDFRILRGALEEGHPGIYRYASKAELDQRFSEAEKALDRPMDVYEFYRVVAPAVAALKCGHTGVRINSNLDKGKPVLPLVVCLLDRKPYILRDLSNAKGTLAGKEVREINGVAVDKIVQTMLAATPGDGDVETSRARRTAANFASNLIDLLGLESPYTITYWDAKQSRECTVGLDGVDAAKLQQQRPKDSATLTFFDDGRIADLKINRFGGTANKKDLHVFLRESFAEISEKKSSALILDLRDNGGGADDLGKLLLSFLIDEPFQYYDDLVLNALDFSFRKYSPQRRALPANKLERQPNGKYRMVTHPNWGLQRPSKPTFTGKVYILINGNSFSTTSEFLSHAHARKRATFIGEESGGGYYGNTSGPGLLLVLPNTKLQAYVPLMTYYMAVRDYKAASHGVVPDYSAKYTIDELLEGKDKELALALELARKS